ncbi:hypothetical protein ACLOJK_036437 [Asimina triloba]
MPEYSCPPPSIADGEVLLWWAGQYEVRPPFATPTPLMAKKGLRGCMASSPPFCNAAWEIPFE